MRLSAQFSPDVEADAVAGASPAGAAKMTAVCPEADRPLPAPGPAEPATELGVPVAERGLLPAERGLRADATRNRVAILTAARQVFAEQGLRAPLEEIARRAQVGIATLYRRFPTRERLIAAALIEKIIQYEAAASQALAE